MTVKVLSPEVAPQLAVELGLTPTEYEGVVEAMGRIPSLTELYMFSLMWSEHCSYKHSRKALRMFPTTGPYVLQGPGENAGVISVGDGWAVAFKMESHNHPSAIEPYEGAATGVGGAARDIFSMGARPIAALSSLRFGELSDPRQRFLFREAVRGIGGYSSRIGVPAVGGEVYFDEAYEGNCLVNAMLVGVMREENLATARAEGPGNPVVMIGSTTGRDGIGGASILASQEFTAAPEEMRPPIQVGDPFLEKQIIEACLELLDRQLFVAIADLGAAGFTSAASEMAARGGVGIEIDVTKVPVREEGMQPFEIMVAESQERMLAVVTPEDLDEVVAVCERWEVPIAVVGRITDTGHVVILEGDEVVGDMPAIALAEAPLYDPPMERPAYIDEAASFDLDSLELADSPEELTANLLAVLASPNVASRKSGWEQLDSTVGNNTVALPGGDAAVMRIGAPGRGEVTNRGIAITADCNPRYVYLDPYRGAQIALAEAARNLACVGADPAAITDCLNFGSPEKPEVFYTFHESIRGMADACSELGIPVVSGNVSFYNEYQGVPILPTPAIGMVGVIEDLSAAIGSSFVSAGDTVILFGETADELGGSEYLSVVHGLKTGAIPAIDLEHEANLGALMRDLIGDRLLRSAHDCSEGGIGAALAESCVGGRLGVVAALDDDLRPAASLFSETQGRIVVSVQNDDVEHVLDVAERYGVPYSVIGEVGGDHIVVDGKIDVSLAEAVDAFEESLGRLVGAV